MFDLHRDRVCVERCFGQKRPAEHRLVEESSHQVDADTAELVEVGLEPRRAVQPKAPSGPTIQPSSETPIE